MERLEERISYFLIGVVGGCIMFILSNVIYSEFYPNTIDVPTPISIMEEEQGRYPDISVLRGHFTQLGAISDWDESSLLDKITAFWTINEIEQFYLGNDDPISVRVDRLEKNEYSRYDENNAEIILDAAMMINAKSPEKPLREMLFWTYHYYEGTVIEAYHQIDEMHKQLVFFDDIRTFEEEFKTQTLDELINNKENISTKAALKFAFLRASYYMQLFDENKGVDI